MVEAKSISNQDNLAAQQDQAQCLACMEECQQGYEHWDITGDVPKLTDRCKANQICPECSKKWGNKCPICKVRVCTREYYLVVKFYRMVYERLYPVAGKYIHHQKPGWLYPCTEILSKFDDNPHFLVLFETDDYVIKNAHEYISEAICVLYMYCDIDQSYQPYKDRSKNTSIGRPLDGKAKLWMVRKGIPHVLATELILANMERIYREVERSEEPKYMALELIVELMRRGGEVWVERLPTQLFNIMQDVESFKKATLKFDHTNEECLRLWSLRSTEQAE